jgi:hypothetical protein
MIAQELRIGNWYKSVKFGVPVQCTLTDFYDLCAKSDGATDHPPIDKMFEPIQLTEEWALKLGIFDNGVFPANEYFSINIDENYCSLYFEDGYTAVDFRYVHQLQNLCWGLFGEELTLNKE